MSLPTPYFDYNGITIYHGDCLDFCSELLPVDLLIADPPFFMPIKHYAARSEWARAWGDTSVLSSWWNHALTLLTPRIADSGSAFVFCDDESYSVFYPPLYVRFPALSALVWNKGRIGMGSPWRHSFEFILHARTGISKWCGSAGESDVLNFSPVAFAVRDHPVSKPRPLLSKLISVTTNPGDIVLDPFMGGGSTLDAARDLGRRAIGIEIEERYCEIAARRLAQSVLALEPAARTAGGGWDE
jgi:site-specific DNA-methyltransferase (adenine-specific)